MNVVLILGYWCQLKLILRHYESKLDAPRLSKHYYLNDTIKSDNKRLMYMI